MYIHQDRLTWQMKAYACLQHLHAENEWRYCKVPNKCACLNKHAPSTLWWNISIKRGKILSKMTKIGWKNQIPGSHLEQSWIKHRVILEYHDPTWNKPLSNPDTPGPDWDQTGCHLSLPGMHWEYTGNAPGVHQECTWKLLGQHQECTTTSPSPNLASVNVYTIIH